MILRPYQRQAIDATRDALHDRPVLVAPTGSGKTVMGATLVDELGLRTLWLAHRRELIAQAAERLRSLGLQCGEIIAGKPMFPAARVQVASVQTAVRRELPPADLIVVDEAHHARSETYRAILSQFPGVPVVGLTATPFRLDGKGLGDVFGKIVVAAYTDDLCRDGTLVEPVVYAPPGCDMSGAKIRAGEYTEADMFARMANAKITGDIVDTWKRRAGGRRTVCFAVNVEHSNIITDAFRAAGVAAEHLDGDTPRAQRDAILHRLRTGYTTIVSNCMVLSEGWDLPALEIAIIARPTASLCLHLQTLGRIMRSADGKLGATVLDHAGNHLRHGWVTQRIDYSLDDKIQKGGVKGASPGKVCRECYAFNDLNASECDVCGAPFASAPGGREIEQVDGELEELRHASRVPFAELQAAWRDIETRRLYLGYREGWAAHQFHNRFGAWPTLAGRELVDPSSAGTEQRLTVYLQLVRTAKERGFTKAHGWAAHQFKAKFGDWPPWSWRKTA